MKKLLSHPLILTLFLIPALLSILIFEMKFQNLQQFHEILEKEALVACALKEKSKKQKEILLGIQKGPTNHLSTSLHSLLPLEGERKRLAAISTQKKASHLLAERLEFLRSDQNKLVFLEEKREKGKEFQEVYLKLKNPVEMDENDLKQTLGILENGSTEKPQIIIKEFDLTKKKTISDEEVFSINLQLIQREAL